MEAGPLKVKALFQKDVRYVIPTFQRPYVWNQDDQWEPLWDDIRNTAELYREELQKCGGDEARAEEETGTHFMGAVVLQQLPTSSKEIEARTVIDGQQRMTTIQIVLDATQEVFEALRLVSNAKRLSRLVVNRDADGDDAFKLWPTLLDRDPFRAAMANDADGAQFAASPIVQAHDFFRVQVEEWLREADDEDEAQARADALEAALSGLLEMVVIDLGTRDDAFASFETLNARGTPLRESDLIKNFIMQTATAQGVSADQLHSETWADLEVDWWRDEVRQGRLTRPRVDMFLNYWLIMRTASDVTSSQVFRTFRDYVESENRSIALVAADVVSVGKEYRALDSVTGPSDLETFVYRWRTMEAGASTPLLLWLAARKLDPAEHQACLDLLESFLVRRMCCRMTTKDYNRLFLDVLAHLGGLDAGASVAGALNEFLASQSAESRSWPTDVEFTAALVDLPLYRLLTRGRLRLVLEAIEDALRSDYAEEPNCPRGLTIEHVMPRSWEEHWPIADDTDAASIAIERSRTIHSLGNLTLLSKKLNPSLSNSAWSVKAKGLSEHITLHLNKNLLNTWGDTCFDDQAIKARGAALAGVACSVWPRGEL